MQDHHFRYTFSQNPCSPGAEMFFGLFAVSCGILIKPNRKAREGVPPSLPDSPPQGICHRVGWDSILHASFIV